MSVQGNWRERCKIQSAILWYMSLRSSHVEEWMGQFCLPPSAWVRYCCVSSFNNQQKDRYVQHGAVLPPSAWVRYCCVSSFNN